MLKIKSKRNEFLLLIRSFGPSLSLFQKNDPLRLAGATAFFTTFALPPIVFILAQLFGIFFGHRNLGPGLIDNISNTLGNEGAKLITQVIRSIHRFNDSWYIIFFGFLFLLFVATTLFTVIKNSFNQIWQIKIKDHPGLLFAISIRLRSFAIILLVGFLFFADLLFESLGMVTSNYLDTIYQGGGIYFKSIMSQIGSVVIVSAWFSMLFHFLADGRPSWKASFVGGILTGILFTTGKFLLKVLLVESNIGNLYGASGSFVLVLLFVFYTSFILYFGACFIAVYSAKKQWPIKPNNKAHLNSIITG